MITKELFIRFIDEYNTFESSFERIEIAIYGKKYSSDLFESDLYRSVEIIVDTFLHSHFTKSGVDLIYWWLFEDVEKIIYEKAEKTEFFDEFKEDKETSVETIGELWDYMEKHKNDYLL